MLKSKLQNYTLCLSYEITFYQLNSNLQICQYTCTVFSVCRPSTIKMINTGEFEPIMKDPIFNTEPIKRQLLVTLGPNTQQSPKVKGLFTWLMSRRYWKQQFNMQVIRSSHGETPSWKVCYDTQISAVMVSLFCKSVIALLYCAVIINVILHFVQF